jgi:hypothetical protein
MKIFHRNAPIVPQERIGGVDGGGDQLNTKIAI